MSGHRWPSPWPLCLLICLTGCQSGESGRMAWNPFRKLAEKPVAQKENAAFSLPKFARRQQVEKSIDEEDSATPIAEEQVDRLLADGQQALQDERLDDARAAYSQVLDASPDNATAHHGMAMAADLSQQWSDAEYHYRQALRIRPRDANLLCDIGYSYLLQDRYAEASRYLNHAIEVSPQHESAHMNLALLDLRQGNRQAAENRITSRFGSSAQSAQILAQLESQTSAVTAAFKTEASHVIPPNATFEQIQEIARQERLEAIRRRATQSIPQQDMQAAPTIDRVAALPNPNSSGDGITYDTRTGLPLNQPGYGNHPNPDPLGMPYDVNAATGITAESGHTSTENGPFSGLSQNPQQWVNAPNPGAAQNAQSAEFGHGITAPPMNNSAMNVATSGTQPPLTIPSNGARGATMNSHAPNPPQNSLVASMGGQYINQPPVGWNGQAGGEISTNVNSNPVFNPTVSSGPSPSVSAPTPGGTLPQQRVIPVHPSGAYLSPPVGSVSYGQPIGFESTQPAHGNQSPMANVSSTDTNPRIAMSSSGMNGAPQNSYQQGSTSGQPGGTSRPLYLDGLNAGPGSIFPIGQPGQSQPADASGQPPAERTDQLNMSNVSSPGSNSMINGLMYDQPTSALPSQEWANQQQQQLRSQQLQSQRWLGQQSPGLSQSNGGTVSQGNPSTWQNARPATVNPLESYDRQRQKMDSEYNKTLQQMDQGNTGGIPQFQ